MHHARLLRLAVIGAALAILLAQGVATLLLLERAREAAVTAAEDKVGRIGRAVEASLNRNFVQVDAMLAGLPAILAPLARDGRFDADGASRVLRELNNQNFTFRDVLLVGPDAMPIATGLPVSRRRALPLSLTANFVDSGPNAGGVMIGGPVRNPVTGEWALFLARPVTMPVLGRVTAVAEVPVPLISSLMGLGGEATGLRVTLERDDGTLLAALPHDETRIGRRLQPTAPELAGHRQIRSRFNDHEVLALVRPTLYPALFITATVDLEEALSGWAADRERALLVSGGFAILVLALAAALLLGLRQRERVEAERARWRSTLENALESMSDGFVMFGPDNRLIACNQRYREFYRISAPFIQVGAQFRDIMREGAKRGQYPQAGGDIEAFIDEMDRWRHANNPPIERLLPDGRWVLITERSTPDGGTVGIRTDITPLKRAMEELASARDAAHAAGQAKSEFLARMSHELRTPLNGVLGFAQVLLRDPELTASQREQVTTLHDAGRHLLDLVNTLLDLSKIEAGKLDLHLKHMAVRPLLESCAGLLAPEVARKLIDFTLEIGADTPEAVEADATRLRQMLLNLLSNAVKFTPHGGAVALRASGAAGQPGWIRIEVQDTGPGVPADKQHMLFEDFSQLAPVAGEGSGTGLGLAISARLAAAMGGRIGIDAELAQGALFWVELPLKEVPLPVQEEPHPPAPAPMEQIGPRSLRVLVADDVAANRMVARAMLAAAGHRVDSASDGAEALAAVQRETYDVVLMDLQMPVMDGLEASRRIRALPDGRASVPILAVTASVLPEQVEACRVAGMDGHLAKPIDRESLLAAVAQLAAGTPLPARSGGPHGEQVEPLLDPAALRSLAADLGATADLIITEFVAELRLALDTLSRPATATDTPLLRQAAHRLLGAARTLGARRLAAATEALQAELHAGLSTATSLARVLEVAEATLSLLGTALEQPRAADDGAPAGARLGAPVAE
jgi:signal transduction histidine kinase/CheY-like chemotaxis protein/HPt (histidine-containing phosphotransfer) domain-containing protein